ncbi:DNA-directed DNA polymerase [Melia azedarach]|uniref:DNA-directed DNA polymerase n=1 Tax=Melia azedarach TaxID=155640 RepID=A0ACC1X322_MELAZ|nr:DNA-directed DNA polymerase [Melia azedarach]
MAEKKGDSSQASSSFDNRRFISCEAEKRFTKFKEDEKAIMRERALKPDPGDGKILEFIRAQNWETLATNPTLVVISLVREFYANALGQSSKKFSSDTKPNPKDQCKATTLGSGKELEPPKPKDKMKKSEVSGKEVKDEAPTKVSMLHRISFLDNPPMIAPPLPFPQSFQKKKLDAQFSKFLEMLKKLYINILFTDALEQMPNYVKFIKKVMSKKRRLEEYETVKLTEEYETVKLTEECSSILQRKLPKKEKVPGSFTILCTIRNSSFKKALCDLGASIKMLLLIFWKLGLGVVKLTIISLQMVDISLTYPRGIIKDVPVKVDKISFPTDFVVLDIEKIAKFLSYLEDHSWLPVRL